jgi:hypothetical protein
MNKADRRAVEAAEVDFLRYVAVYTCKDQIHNDNVRQKLEVFNLNDGIQQNIKNWYEHVLHVDPSRITQQIFETFEDLDDIGKMTLKRNR